VRVQEKIKELAGDRVFLGIFLTGVLISFFASVNQIGVLLFLGFFLSGSLISLMVALSWSEIQTGYLRVLAILAVFLVSGIAGIFYFQGQTSCLAWSAYSAENPVTNTCHAYVYGGCGPTPDPWYYQDTCSPEAKDNLCQDLRESGSDEDERLAHHLCTETPEFNISVIERDRENETLALKVSESSIDASNTRSLRIGGPDETLRLERNGTVYNTSLLLSPYQESVFESSVPENSSFTVLRDEDDLDDDGIQGVDSREGNLIHLQFSWQDRITGNTASLGFTINGSRNTGGSWVM